LPQHFQKFIPGDVYGLEKYPIQRTVEKHIRTERSRDCGTAFVDNAREKLYTAELFVRAARSVSS